MAKIKHREILDDEPAPDGADSADAEATPEARLPIKVTASEPVDEAELANAFDGEADPDEDTAPAEPPPVVPAASPPIPVKRRELRQADREQRRVQRDQVRATPSPGMAEIRRREDQDLKDYILSLTDGSAQMKVMVSRQAPEMHQGVAVKGHLETVDHAIDEQWIKERHGGGKFMLRIQKLTDNGQYHIVKNLTLEIAGDPITTRLEYNQGGKQAPTAAPAPGAGDSVTSALVSRAFDVMSRPPQAPGLDGATIDRLLAPYREELARMREALAQKDNALTDAMTKPRDPYQDRFVQKLMDDDSSRITSIKMAHETELRTVRENHREDVKRLEDRHQREADYVIRNHEREIANLKEAHSREMATMKMGYDAQLTMQQTTKIVVDETRSNEAKRLEREVDRLTKEVAELRKVKDKTIIEQVKELNVIREALGENDDDDDKDKGVLSRLIESPLMGKLVDKVGKAVGDDKPAAPQMPHGFAPGVPYKLTMADGSEAFYVNRPDGTAVPIQPGKKKKVITPTSSAGAPAGPQIEIDPADLKTAIDFMEAAQRGGKDPEEFARSVRNMVPASVLKGLAAMGVDDFLDKVAQLDPTHSLSMPAGRSWARQVAAALTGTEAPPQS